MNLKTTAFQKRLFFYLHPSRGNAENKNESLFLHPTRGNADNEASRSEKRGFGILAREDKNNPNGLFLPQAA